MSENSVANITILLFMAYTGLTVCTKNKVHVKLWYCEYFYGTEFDKVYVYEVAK